MSVCVSGYIFHSDLVVLKCGYSDEVLRLVTVQTVHQGLVTVPQLQWCLAEDSAVASL